ncbi:FAD-dependent monooxygenase [Williamsia soli]|uniref:FAD-dependent monooxygenase n=1 Tax=Williamsia soli TaxID=364929 RepID=UPI001A9DD2BA|nr:FAD-dependent monooxygenase [Williamsia soli]
MTDREETQVLVIGAGPAGLATAYVLGQYGIPSIVCDQHGGVHPHPRAHVVNTRSMEMFRAWGVADAVASDDHALDTSQGMRVVWRHSLAGEEFGHIDTSEVPAERLRRRREGSPVNTISCPQDRIQSLLVGAVTSQGVSRVDYDTRVVAVEDGAHSVTATVEVQGATKKITAQYVVNAEGAAGRVRAALGIDVDGVPKLGDQVTTYFHADLSRWTGDAPPLLSWVVNTEIQGVFVSMGRNRWTFTTGFDADESAEGDFTSQRCIEMIESAIGSTDVDVDIDVRSTGTWTLGATIAQKFRKGRVFLVGDTAHQFPPTGGFGMNTGLGDADNLAWKLAAVLQGRAPERLLDTYEYERQAVARANSEFSVTNAIKMAATGVGPAAGLVAEELESADPAVSAAVRDRLKSEIPNQLPHFDDIDLEIGYVYGPSTDKDAITAPIVGGRLPHKWITRDGAEESTLDLLGPRFTLIAGPAWTALAEQDLRVGSEVVQLLVEGRDFGFTDAAKTLGVDEGGAVLVRPDGHIVWIGDHLPSDPAEALASAIDDLYCSATGLVR